MASFPYINNPATLKQFIAKIQTTGKPDKVTLEYIASLGFKSKNDRPILPILKAIGFVDNSGVPTDAWSQYRNKQEAPKVLGLAIKSSYPGLFTAYPDAHRKDNEALRDYFSTHTSVGDKALSYIVRTFKTLCEMADFETPITPEIPMEKTTPAVPGAPPEIKVGVAPGMTVNLNVQLQLPPTEDSSVYEKLFAAMKKHLFS